MNLAAKMGLLASLALLLGCETMPRPGDTDPPNLTVLESIRGLPVVFTTDPERTPAPATCPDGSRPFDGAGSGMGREIDNIYSIQPPGRERATLAFLLSDASGIRSASLSFDARTATVHEPDLPVETRAAHGRRTGQFYIWSFRETGTLRTGQTVTIDLTVAPGPVGIPFSVSATDGAGNRRDVVFFVTRASSVCG